MVNTRGRVASIERKLRTTDKGGAAALEYERQLFERINAGLVRLRKEPLPIPEDLEPGMADKILSDRYSQTLSTFERTLRQEM